MRWLPLSATAILPSRPTATPLSAWNSPSPSPGEPNLNANVPLGWNTWMRSKWRSATMMRPSIGDTATAYR